MDNDLFLTDITPEETSAGYSIQEIENPREHDAFALPTISAIVFPLGPSDRIVKLWNPIEKRAEYKRQRFGTWVWDTAGKPDWLPFSDTSDNDPHEAILKARAGVQDDSTSKITPHVPD